MDDDAFILDLEACVPHEIPRFSFAGQNFYTRIIDMYDGDSFRIVVHVNGVTAYAMTRLVGIDTAEMKSKTAAAKAIAQESRDFALSWALKSSDKTFATKKDIKAALADTPAIVFVKCHDNDRYGRVLVEVFRNREDAEASRNSLNQLMIAKGGAVAYDGGTKAAFE
jgi:endonuclease YncB( thermonuclease family)